MEPATNRRNQFRQQLAGDLATTQSLLENGFPSKHGSIAWSTMISSPSWIPAPTIDQPDTRKMKVAQRPSCHSQTSPLLRTNASNWSAGNGLLK